MPEPRDLERLFELSGRVALVTGAAAGLGQAIALGLAQYGADVFAADLNLEGAEQTARRIRELGRRAEAHPVDVTDWEQVQAMAQAAIQAFDRIDIAFNVPGSNVRKPALEMTPEEYERIVRLNQLGVFHCAKAVGEVMVRQRRGKMVNIASIYGHVALEGQAAYASSKHAVVGLTKVLALEWAPFNVQVNCLSPGYMATDLTRPIRDNQPFYERLVSRTPQKRFGEPWEIVGPAIFLASDASSFVTGSALVMDGGWTAL